MTVSCYRVKPLPTDDPDKRWPFDHVYVSAVTPGDYAGYVGRIGKFEGAVSRWPTGELLQVDLKFETETKQITLSFAPWMLEAIEDEYALP